MIYSIKKGDRSPLIRIPKLYYNKKYMKIEFNFLQGCWFEKIVKDDEDINKLYGFSHGDHNQNSVRIGWVPNNDMGYIDLFFYIHNSGIIYTKYFDTIKEIENIIISITLNNGNCIFEKNDGYMERIEYIIPPEKLGYRNFPYIGGDLPAKQDMKIMVNELA